MSDSTAGAGRQAFMAVLRRDLLLAFRQRNELLQPLLFLLVITALFPLGVGPEAARLALIAPGVIWIAALLAGVLALDRLFRADHENGVLEQLLIHDQPLVLMVSAKLLAHWLTTGLPVILLAPLLAAWLNLAPEAWPTLVKSLALGTPILTLVGGIGAALTVGLRQAGQLLALLVFPLLVPMLVFATLSVSMAASGLDPVAEMRILAALSVLSLTLAPFATAAALKISLS